MNIAAQTARTLTRTVSCGTHVALRLGEGAAHTVTPLLTDPVHAASTVWSSTLGLPMSSEQTAEVVDKVDLSKIQPKKVFTPENGAAMAALATMAYSDPRDQKKHLAEQSAVESFHFLDSKNNARLGIHAPDTGTQLSVVETKNALLIAARGTTPPWLANIGKENQPQKQDYLNDLNTDPVKNYDKSADVHAGFKNAADGIWGQVSPLIKQASAAHKAIMFSGHSLGAAVALQLADRTHEQLHIMPASVIRTGGPDIGWDDEKKHLVDSGLAARTVNFINNTDPVPHVLPGGQAAGYQVYFNHSGKAELGNGSHDADRALGATEKALELNLNPIYDHVPPFYNERIQDPRNATVLAQLERHIEKK